MLDDAVSLTADLFADAPATDSDLEDARRTVVRALRRGQRLEDFEVDEPVRPTPRRIDVVDTAVLPQLESLLQEPDDPSEATPVVLRGHAPPIAGDGPAWQRGRRVSRRLGPFRDRGARPVWFDVHVGAVTVLVTRRISRPQRAPLMVPTVALAGARVTATGRIEVEDGGAVWVRAAAFDSAAPEAGWVGVAVASCVLEADSAFASGPGSPTVVVPEGATLRLDLRPAPVASATGSGPLGADGRRVTLELPDRLRMSLSALVPSTIALDGTFRLGIWGNDLTTASPSAVTPSFDAATSAMVVPLTSDVDTVGIAGHQSATYTVSGSAPVESAALSLPVTVLADGMTAQGLGLVDGPPAIRLRLGAGLTASTAGMVDPAGHATPLTMAAAHVHARPGELRLEAEATTDTAAERVMRAAWAGATGAVTLPGERSISLGVVSVASPPLESVTRTGVRFRAMFERPLLASGRPLELTGRARLREITTADEVSVLLERADLDEEPTRSARSFALDNGLLRSDAASGLELHARRSTNTGPDDLEAGWLSVAFDLDLVVPALPDPYASDFLPWDGDHGEFARRGLARLVAQADWYTPFSAPHVRLDIDRVDAPLIDERHARRSELPMQRERREVEDVFSGNLPPRYERCRLLDVSGAADFLGVSLLGPANVDGAPDHDAPELFATDGISLTAPIASTHLFLVPGFLNEQVANVADPAVLDPFPAVLRPLGDAGPQRLSTSDQHHRVPLTPRRVAHRLVEDFPNGAGRNLEALVSLPFGIRAAASLNAFADGGGAIGVVGAATEGDVPLGAAWQLRLEASTTVAQRAPGLESPSLPGVAQQLPMGRGLNGVPTAVLGATLTSIFNQDFAPGADSPRIPALRLDVAGHGNSIVSDWNNPAVGTPTGPATGVRQARFDAFVGRTAFEVVQVAATCHPWRAVFVRSVTLRRTSAGVVWRSDSGWKAAGDGLVDYPAPVRRHLGAVQAVREIRNIRETGRTHVAGPVELRSVRFDALASIAGAAAPTPIRDVEGWVQIRPSAPLSADALYDLLDAVGPAEGVIDTTVDVGESGQQLRARTAGIALTAESGQRGLCGVVRGSLALPPRGTWTITRHRQAEDAPRPLGPGELLPLVGTSARARFRDPVDLFAAAPATEYGVVHSSDVHTLYLPDVFVDVGSATLSAGRAPLLADQFAMAGHAALVPPGPACIELPPATVLEVPELGHLLLSIPGGPTFTVAPNVAGEPWRVVVLHQQGTGDQMRLEYRDANGHPTTTELRVDTRAPQGEHYALQMRSLSLSVDHDGLGNFATTTGQLQGSSQTPAAFAGAAVVFSGALSAAQTIIDLLKGFSFPGAFAALASEGEVLVSFGGTISFPPEWTARRDGIHPPTGMSLDPGKSYAPTGGPKLKGEIGAWITLYEGKPGQHAGLRPYHGAFRFEIAGKALFPTGIPLLYGGGSLKFSYQYSTMPRQNEQHTYEAEKTLALYAGSAGNLGTGKNPVIDAELTATYHFVLKFVDDAFKFGIQYQIEAKVEVLKGLAELAGGFEVMAVPKRLKLPDGTDGDIVEVEIEATIAGEVTLAWAFSTEITVPVKFTLELGMATFAGFLLQNPLLWTVDPFV